MSTLRARYGLPPRWANLSSTPSASPWCHCRRLQTYTPASRNRPHGAKSRVGYKSPNAPRLRFAPSPTGQLHLGGLRTALLNELFARSNGGSWILRIEDTDQSRYVPGAVEGLQEALRWAGLSWDEGPSKGGDYGPYTQSERLETYREWAHRLIDQGHAYYDFRPATDRSSMAVRKSGREQYDPPDEEQAQDMLRDGKAYSIRLRFEPQAIEHDDLVFGHMTFPPDHDAEDPVLLKQDGWPTYHLSSVVDDHLMRITHVFRGEEWLPSLPKHLVLYRALGLRPPQFAHLPLLMNDDGSKLSKRSGHASVEDYRRKGYEPEALINFIALMGYNHHGGRSSDDGHESDVLSMADLVNSFDVSRISQSRAALNLPKLDFLNKHHLRRKIEAEGSPEHNELLGRLREGLKAEYHLSEAELYETRLHSIMNLIFVSPAGSSAERVLMSKSQDRASTLPEMVQHASVLFRAVDWTGDAAVAMRKGIQDDIYRATLRKMIDLLELQVFLGCPEDAAALVNLVAGELNPPKRQQQGDSKPRGSKGAVMKSLRHALTGEPAGPTVPDLLAALGKNISQERLREALAHDERVSA